MNTVLTHTNGKSAGAQEWLQQSVREFFSAFNWENKPPEIQELTVHSLQGDTSALSLTLTVQQFFAAIPWDGATIAAPVALEVTTAATPTTPDFTLDDFSSLFG